MLKDKMLYGLNDVTIVPVALSSINSRSECFTNYPSGCLPLFAAPMSSVIDDTNYKVFEDSGIRTVIPRNIPFERRMELSGKVFVAVGLVEFRNIVENMELPTRSFFCIDIANGHMKSVYDLCKMAKEKFDRKISIMVGNIANPLTYHEICKKYHGIIDYVRCGIGGGSCCTTSANTSIHYPMASLISEMRKCKEYYHGVGLYDVCPEIIADGGFHNFDQIIKALALGADYVMLGNILARCEEACGDTIEEYNVDAYPKAIVYDEYADDDDYSIYKSYVKLREYYGMSTKKAQKEFGGEGNKTSEGIIKRVPVEYTLEGWIDNFKSYLKSAMSYTDFRYIEDFIGGPTLLPMTNSAFNAYFK